MSLIIKNVCASNKLLLPNGRTLKVGTEIKVSESILNSSLVRKLISENKLTVRKVTLGSAVSEISEAITEIASAAVASSVSKLAIVAKAPDIVEEVSQAVEAISDLITEETSVTIIDGEDKVASDSEEAKPRTRRSVKKEDKNG
jgi:Pyruvate/2-oxoacid:ferredoxin oxidoreductase gamma subunit